MELVPGASTLHIENWETGQTLVDLDLRGHLQLLCIDRPCLSICQVSASVDASGLSATDAGVSADSGAVDGNALDAAASASTLSEAGAN